MIRWQTHIGYDLFISLFVLHHPKRFGLRASWAAGVRQRMDETHRLRMERIQRVTFVPLPWLSTLPETGSAQETLEALNALPPEQAFVHLFAPSWLDAETRQYLEQVRRGAPLTETAREHIRRHYHPHGKALKPADLEILLQLWQQPEESTRHYLDALAVYWRVFFQEEEQRIAPYLHQAVEEAQALAERTPLPDLLTRLSRGVRLATLDEARQVTLAPSFWSAPLIFTARLPTEGAHVFVFGARPETVNLVPGVPVPDDLVSRLKALSDATRLRILKSLLIRPATATELARQLRLRPPTLVHHLRILRLAGLVQITIDDGHERVYALRAEGLLDLQQTLMKYLSRDS